MLKGPTLFIIGAGASHEFGLPIGATLADEISKSLDLRFGDFGTTPEGQGDWQIYRLLQQEAQQNGARDVNPYLHACWLVRDGIQLSYSIDNFLDKHAHEPKVQLCGRIAIVKRILEAERRSKLYVNRDNIYNTINFQIASDTWIVALFKMLQDKVRLELVNDFFKDVCIITFNYDRCIEHFFFHALKRNYGLDDTAAAAVMKGLDIIHAYGRVGRLPWEPHSSEQPVEFGEVDRAPLMDLWSGIRTYTDERDDGDLVDRIQERVRQSDQIVFLGFSYQEQNLDLLGHQTPRDFRRLLGSTFGISPYNTASISEDLTDRYGPNTVVTLAPETCAGLLNAYSRMLA